MSRSRRKKRRTGLTQAGKEQDKTVEIQEINRRFHIILASASPRRKELLTQIGMTFEVMKSCGEEIMTKTEPKDAVMELAAAKAEEVFARCEAGETEYGDGEQERIIQGDHGSGSPNGQHRYGRERLIIAADTVVAADGMILGKPKDEADAVRMLTMLQGRTHQVYTGVTLLSAKGQRTFYECTEVTFVPMTREQIEEYVRTGDPLDKAGAYGIQGCFAAYVSRIEGDYYNVVGLPLARLVQEIGNLGHAAQDEEIGKKAQQSVQRGSADCIRLVATDIDGTLVKDSSPEVYPEIIQMFRDLNARGIVCCVASGRQYHSIRRMFEGAGENIVYIAENGAHIVYRGRTLSVTDMKKEQAHEIIREMRACGEGYEFVVSTPEGSLLESRDDSFICLIRDSYHNQMEVVPDVLENDPQIIKCAMHHNGSVRQVAEKELIPRWHGRVKVCMAGEEWIDFMDAAVDKGNAIRFVQDYFDIGCEETMAFGDNENDIGMMKAAGESYAVENACSAVKEAAKYICPGYTEKGVYQVLRRMLQE